MHALMTLPLEWDTPTETTPQTTPDTELPPEIARIEVALQEEWQALDTLQRLEAAQVARWSEFDGRCHYMREDADPITTIVEAALDATVKVATALLSRPGAPARLDLTDYRREVLGLDRGTSRRHRFEGREEREARLRAFQPSQVWAYLQAQYGPERVQHEALQRAALALMEGLQLYRNDRIKQVGGRTEICLQMWSEPSYSGDGTRKYGYNSARAFAPLPEAFQVVMAHANLAEDVAAGAIELAGRLQRSNTTQTAFRSRERTDYAGGISLVTFNDAIKLYLPAALAQAINLFVSEHAGEQLREKQSRYQR